MPLSRRLGQFVVAVRLRKLPQLTKMLLLKRLLSLQAHVLQLGALLENLSRSREEGGRDDRVVGYVCVCVCVWVKGEEWGEG